MTHPDGHLTESEARALLRRELSLVEAYRAGLHMRSCTRCWELADRVDSEGLAAFARAYGLTRSKRRGAAPSSHTGWMDMAGKAQRQMATLREKLEPLPAERRRLLLKNLDSVSLQCKFVTIASFCKKLFLSNPNEAIDLAAFGLELLARRRGELGGEAYLSFQASLLAHYGNGLRIVGDLRKAERCLRKAEQLSVDAGEPFERAWACRYLGYVLADSRKYEEALRSARTAKRTFEAVHERKLALETEGVEAKILADLGKYEESVNLLKTMEAPVAKGGYSELELSVKERLAVNYLHLDSPFHARQLMPRVKNLARSVGGIAIVRAKWLDALTLEAVGDLAAADRLLRRVCSELATDYPYDHAVAALDRMRVLVRQGSLGKATGLLRDLIPLVKGARLHSQAVRALRLLAEQGIEAPVIRAIQDFLGKLQRDPSYTLEDANLPC